jgi:putative SOS response-associated peptidase YedK
MRDRAWGGRQETAALIRRAQSTDLRVSRLWRPTERGNAYGFLTTEPNAIVAPIHPKAMPIVLHDDDYDRWLSAPWDEVKELVAPYPSQLMRLG